MLDVKRRGQLDNFSKIVKKGPNHNKSYIVFTLLKVVFYFLAFLYFYIFRAFIINLAFLKYVTSKVKQGFFVIHNKTKESDVYKKLTKGVIRIIQRTPEALSIAFKQTGKFIIKTSKFTFRFLVRLFKIIKISLIVFVGYTIKLFRKKTSDLEKNYSELNYAPKTKYIDQGKKKIKELALPLYFGWEVVVRKVQKTKERMAGPFKKYWHYASVVTILIIFVSTTLFFQGGRSASAATYNWVQTNWSGGASAITASHPNDQSTWDKYISQDGNVTAAGTLSLATAGGPWTQTNNTSFSANTLTTTTVSGTGDSASVKLVASLGFTKTVIDYPAYGAFTVEMVDIDDDNDLDILSSIFSDNDIVLYQNDGNGNFTEIGIERDIGGASSAHGSDVDGDGDMDVVISAEFWNTIAWYENDGSENFTRHLVDSGFITPTSSWPVDLDSDGDIDILAVSFQGDEIVWYDNDGSESFTERSLYSGIDGPRQVEAKDIDKDGDIDVVLAGRYSDTIDWFENNGSEVFTRHTIKTGYDSTNTIHIDDINQDGEWDILATAVYSDDIGWWENDGNENFTEHIIDPDFDGALGVHSDDIDGDGDIDIMGTSSMDQNDVMWWENDGNENFTPHTIDASFAEGNSIFSGDIDGDGDVDIVAAGRQAAEIAVYKNDTTYSASGNMVSTAQDLGSPKDFTTLDFTATVPANTTLQIQLASNTDNATWNFIGPDGTSGSYYTSSGATIHSSHDDDRYVKYKAFFTTSDTDYSPILDDISINYSYTQTLTSSAYDAISEASVIAGFKWDEDATLPTGTTLTFSARSGADSTALLSAGWNEIASSTSAFLTTGCTKASQTVTCTEAVIPAGMKDQSGDRWMQYKVEMSSINTSTPTIDNITMVYVVNAPPEFEALPTVSQDSNGLVNISYSVRDPDTDTGVTQNLVSPSFEYSLNNGGSWDNITTGLSANATSTKAVAEVSYATYNLTWDAKTQVNGQYTTTAKIRVTANDSEAANNTGSSASAAFVLDTKDPVISSFVVDSRSDAANTLTISTTDDDTTGMQMKLSNNSDLSADGTNAGSGDWINYVTTKSWTLEGSPETIYYQFKDQYGNISSAEAISSTVLPADTSNILFQDVSNPETSEWREFIAWGAISVPANGFKRYNIYRSTDGTNYSLLSTQTDREINYVLDASLNNSNTYYYKIASEDNSDNISNYSSIINDMPNGQGGSDLTSPTINNVASAGITTQSAIITWDTTEASDSTVELITVTGGDFTSAPTQGVATMADTASGLGQHSVTLTGLIPNTTYYYQVKSADALSNSATSKDGVNGYTFTTLNGPTISNVSASDVDNVQAIITWDTNVNANSYVVYSANPDMSSSSEVGIANSVIAHSVSITSLTTGLKYYYYVKSGVAEDKNVVDNEIQYYTFTTTADVIAPVITFTSGTDITSITDTSAMVVWTTGEYATSTLEFGLTTGYGTTLSNDSYNTNHSFSLSSLVKGTLYYIRLKSSDNNGNISVPATASFTTTDSTDYTAPTITFTSGTDITNLADTGVDISWITNEAATSTLEYGLTTSYGTTVSNNSLNTDHSFSLSSLVKGTKYYIRLKSADSTGNISTPTTSSFTTTDSTDYTAPIITFTSGTDITSITDTGADVAWITNESATSTLEYGITDSYGTTVSSDSLNINHSFSLTSLTKGTLYYIRLKSTDNADNISTATTATFTTTDGTDYTAPIITFTSGTDITNLADTSVDITWVTDEAATSTLEYGITDSYGTTATSSSYNINHSFSLSSLVKDTLYYIRLKSTDSSDNTSTATTATFTTTDGTDYTAPTISSVSSDPVYDTVAVINWTTDELTTSLVQYGTAAGVYTAFVADNNSNTTHAISVTGLVASTDYYYNITSTDVSSNATSSPEYTFTTLETLTEESDVIAREEAAASSAESSSSGGGGILIIDKTDKLAPIISNIRVSEINQNSAKVTWITNEAADSYVDFGLTNFYGRSNGSRNKVTNHSVTLNYLSPSSLQHYKITSADADGNLGESSSLTFSTLSIAEAANGVVTETGPIEEEKLTEEALNQRQDNAEDLINLAVQAAQKAMGIIKINASQLSLGFIESSLISQQNSIEELAYLLPMPVMSGDPTVVVTDRTASISWHTDREASSIVAIASRSAYDSDSDSPYLQVIGNPSDRSVEHKVVIYDLEPNSEYHYQLRNKPLVGTEARSRDFVFRTEQEILGIQSYVIQNVSNEKAVFKWVTNSETDSTVKYTPYRNGIPDYELTRTKSNDDLTTIHEIEITNLEAGLVYEVELTSTDISNNIINEIINSFSTSDNDVAPEINQVQTTSAISPGKTLRIQTVISWLTNEPSTTRVYYQKGVAKSGEKLKEETKLDENYTKKHVVVITKFDLGAVYSFQTESIDASGNVALSKIYTVLTPRQEESVFQVIIKNLEGVFGWVKKMQ